MTLYRYKIVPKATPNADGTWWEADIPTTDAQMSWLDLAIALGDYVPEDTHFLVAIERAESNTAAEIEDLKDRIARLRAALELIAGSPDKLQALQAKAALDNIGPNVEVG